jgi:demethylmenaquinone methyltransferase/2-methoxy-6-polyprenyl-1,4-benzoquinol methylase
MTVPGEAYVEHYFPGTGASYDRVVAWTTLGNDRRWKRRMLDFLPTDTSSVLELACGTGILTRMILNRFPKSRVLGVDIMEDYLRFARERFEKEPRVELRLGDATKTPVADRGPFDVVISSYIPKYVDPYVLLDHLTPSIKSGGLIVMHDFSKPRAVVPWLFWRAWMGTLNLIAPWFHKEWANCFDRSLPKMIAESRWVAILRDALRTRGYLDESRIRLTFGMASIVVARKP